MGFGILPPHLHFHIPLLRRHQETLERVFWKYLVHLPSFRRSEERESVTARPSETIVRLTTDQSRPTLSVSLSQQVSLPTVSSSQQYLKAS